MIRRRLEATGGVTLSVCDWRATEGDPASPGRPAGTLPLLLVHGLASNARLWDGVAAVLTAAGHDVVAVDQRGHGLSDKPDDGYDTDTVCADLIAVLDNLGWERSVVVGQSWGGNVVVQLAARYPDRLAGVCGIDGGTLRLAQRFHTWASCLAALTPPPLTGMAADDLRRRLRDVHPDWPEQGIDGAMACFEVRDDGTVAPWLTLEHHLSILAAMFEDDPAQVYSSVTVPVLFLPAADPRQPEWTQSKRRDIDEALGALPAGRVVWFEPADHDVHAQHPDRVAQVLLDHIDEGYFR